jgi:polysaccharide export outer membrane protein
MYSFNFFKSFNFAKPPVAILSLLVLASLVTLPANPAPAYGQTAAQPAPSPKVKARLQYQDNKYVIGPGDVLNLKVLHEPEYTQENILVRPDGYATFPGAGDVYVAEQSVDAVKAKVLEGLAETIVSPQVSLSVSSTRPSTVYLSGEVMQPGMFQLANNFGNASNILIQGRETLTRTDMRLTNILANAGGVSLNADLSNVEVTRSATGEVMKADLWRVLKEGAIEEDVWINSGDRIHIPALHVMALQDDDLQLLLKSSIGPKEFPVRVIGFVDQPGVFQMKGQTPYLNSALAMAGGFLPAANKKVVAVRRFTGDNAFYTFHVNVGKQDVMLRPNDVIFIAENGVHRTGRFGEQVAKTLSPFQSVGQAFFFGANGATNLTK